MPLVQLTVMFALPLGLSGWKSFETLNVAVRSVLVIVQVPTLRRAWQVPSTRSRSGSGLSVAMQSGSPSSQC